MTRHSNLGTLAFVIAAILTLGAIATIAATDLALEPPNRDIWQHVAAIQSLMQNITDPANPFVIGAPESRHFHPLWVGLAAFNLTFDLSVWDGLVVATYVSMAILGIGIYLFARALFADPWAPLLLLLTVLFGWGLQLAHTGFHSVFTLLYGAVYPATFLIGLMFVLWALTIRGLEQGKGLVFLALLSAFMFATHQLGAVIALIGCAAFVLGLPDVPLRQRVLTSTAVMGGLIVSLLWPYHNPLMLMLRPGNSTWDGGPDFYGVLYLVGGLVPAILGVIGMRQRRMWPLAIALVLFGMAFATGLAGVQIAGRFLMPVVLVLQIGLVAYFLEVAHDPSVTKVRKTRLLGGFGAIFAVLFATSAILISGATASASKPQISVYQAAQNLTGDIPDTEQVAAFDVAAWPIVGTGQKVLSVPWPEPGIADLAQRQQAVLNLFDPALSAEDRRALADAVGIRTLITDIRLLPPQTVAILRDQAARFSKSGSMVRIDLYP